MTITKTIALSTMFMVLSSLVIARVHPVHVINDCESPQSTCQPDPQTKSTDLDCE